MNEQKLLTILTPTYNRASHLRALYDSILVQAFPREKYEWLVVDDGSTDDTHEVVESFVRDNHVEVRYIYKENGGVHTAQNCGVRNAPGSYIFRCDSDDLLHEGALLKIERALGDLPHDSFAGICGLCQVRGGSSIIGGRFPRDVMDSTGLELRYTLGLTGERAGCMRRDVLEKFLLPEPPDVMFISESAMWNRIDLVYRTRFINEVYKDYTICASDSITNGMKHRKDDRYYISKYYSYRDQLNTIPQFLCRQKKTFLKTVIGLVMNGTAGGRKLSQILDELKDRRIRLLAMLLAPVSIGIVWYRGSIEK